MTSLLNASRHNLRFSVLAITVGQFQDEHYRSVQMTSLLNASRHNLRFSALAITVGQFQDEHYRRR